jgi:hypothetical protein
MRRDSFLGFSKRGKFKWLKMESREQFPHFRMQSFNMDIFLYGLIEI